jgi:hypothetical protein
MRGPVCAVRSRASLSARTSTRSSRMGSTCAEVCAATAAATTTAARTTNAARLEMSASAADYRSSPSLVSGVERSDAGRLPIERDLELVEGVPAFADALFLPVSGLINRGVNECPERARKPFRVNPLGRRGFQDVRMLELGGGFAVPSGLGHAMRLHVIIYCTAGLCVSPNASSASI